MVTNWKNLLLEELKRRGESFEDIVSNTMTDEDMEREFYSGYGDVNGCAFTVWTKNTVYFPLEYDGAEFVGSVSRKPDGKPTKHQ